jgi:hypothetical protein
VTHSWSNHYTDWAIQDPNIKIDLKEVSSEGLDWIHEAQIGSKRWGPVNMVVDFQNT